MYQYCNNILSIPARLLYDELGVMSYKAYNLSCFRGKIKRTKEGRGKGNEAYIPLHEESLKGVDHAKKQVQVALPDGLLDLYTETDEAL